MNFDALDSSSIPYKHIDHNGDGLANAGDDVQFYFEDRVFAFEVLGRGNLWDLQPKDDNPLAKGVWSYSPHWEVLLPPDDAVFDEDASILTFSREEILNFVPPIDDADGATLVRLAEQPDILVLDFEEMAQMRAVMGRVGVYHIDNGGRRIPGPSQAKDKTFVGVALPVDAIATYYTKCYRNGFDLTEEDAMLLRKLVRHGVLFFDRGENRFVSTGTAKAILALPRVDMKDDGPYSYLNARQITFDHEYAHALVYVDATFAQKSLAVYTAMPEADKAFFGAVFSVNRYCGYRACSEDIVAMELQGHLTYMDKGLDRGIARALAKCAKLSQVMSECASLERPEIEILNMTGALHLQYSELLEGYEEFSKSHDTGLKRSL